MSRIEDVGPLRRPSSPASSLRSPRRSGSTPASPTAERAPDHIAPTLSPQRQGDSIVASSPTPTPLEQPSMTSEPEASLARTTTPLSTTTTLYHPTQHHASLAVPERDCCDRTPSPAPPSIADVVSVFDPASAGGGGPLVRIATAHSQRELARERSRSGTSARPSLFALTRARPEASAAADEAVFDDDEKDSRRDKTDSTEVKERSNASGGDGDEKGACGDKADCYGETSHVEKSCRDEEDGESEAYVYPDGGYGWVVVACCTTLCALTNGWGMNYGVFQQYYAEHNFRTAPTSVLSLAGTTQGFCYSVFAFVAGGLGDRFGFRPMMLASALIAWVGVFSASWSTALWSTILCQGVITGIGQGLAVPLFMSLPSQWFYKHRGLASGIAMGGAGLGGGISTLIVRDLISKVGARKTLLIMSFVNLVAMLIAISLIRTRPASPEAQSPRGPLINKRILGRSEFWSVALSLLVGVIGYPGPFFFLTQYMHTQFSGITEMKLIVPLTVLSFAVCVGRGLVGLCADAVGAMNTYIAVFILSGIIQYALWLTATSYAQVCVFAAVYGLVAPGYLGLMPQIVVTIFGPTALASNVGILLLFNGPGNLVSGPLGGAIFDASRQTSWNNVIITLGALQILGGVLCCWARFRTSPALFSKI